MLQTSSIYTNCNNWPWTVTLTLNLPKQMLEMAHLLMMENKRAMMALDRSPESFSLQMNSTPLVPTCDPQGGASFDPKGHHVNKIDKGLQGDAAYQKPTLYLFQFQRRILKLVFLVPMFQLVTPGWDQFWPHEHHMNKLGRCPQGDAKNQISKVYTFQFQRKRILKMGFFVPMSQLVTHWLGPILTLGASYQQTW